MSTLDKLRAALVRLGRLDLAADVPPAERQRLFVELAYETPAGAGCVSLVEVDLQAWLARVERELAREGFRA
ncbi:MAG: hypothetical protein AAF682_19565 [Planctomycetota bacterium]